MALWLIIFCILVITIGGILCYFLYKIIKAANLDGSGSGGDGGTNSVAVETSVSPFYYSALSTPALALTNSVLSPNQAGFAMQYGLIIPGDATNLVLQPFIAQCGFYCTVTDGVPDFYTPTNSPNPIFTLSYSGTLWLVNEALGNTNGGFDVPNNGGLPTNVVVIQASPDLVNWNPIFTNMNCAADQVLSFTDQLTISPRQFYRAVYLTNSP